MSVATIFRGLNRANPRNHKHKLVQSYLSVIAQATNANHATKVLALPASKEAIKIALIEEALEADASTGDVSPERFAQHGVLYRFLARFSDYGGYIGDPRICGCDLNSMSDAEILEVAEDSLDPDTEDNALLLIIAGEMKSLEEEWHNLLSGQLPGWVKTNA